MLRVFLIKQVLILNKQCLLEIFPYKMKYANLSVCLLFNRLFKLVVVALTQTIEKNGKSTFVCWMQSQNNMACILQGNVHRDTKMSKLTYIHDDMRHVNVWKMNDRHTNNFIFYH